MADVLIIGSGIAGLATALACPKRSVTLITPDALGADGASVLAQGGLAAAIDDGDSPQLHAIDTLTAGAGHGDPKAVEILTSQAPASIARLEALGARFDHDGTRLRLGHEAAHRHPRIVHAGGDASGREVMRVLATAVRNAAQISTVLFGRVTEIATVGQRAIGVWWQSNDNQHRFLPARDIVLATGGIGGIYLKTTAPAHIHGSGIALAAATGAHLRDLEFVQFHPTVLDTGQPGQLPLLTEALRGAGAKLVDQNGRPIMPHYHADGDLAPRSIVARAIALEQRAGKRIFLDACSAIGTDLPRRFPTVWAACRQYGFDPRSETLPVTPAAHYHMGGVAVDQWGRSNVTGLWAVGETACTGVHGANRLASNALIEGLVYGERLGQALNQATIKSKPIHAAPSPRVLPCAEDPAQSMQLRELMWEQVGVLRTRQGLRTAAIQLQQWQLNGLFNSSNLWAAASAIVRAACQRQQSIGAHWLEHDTKSLDRRHCVT